MAVIKIPERDIKPLKMLAALPVGSKESLVSALKDAQPSLLLRELTEQIADKVGIDRSDLRDIISMLGRMYMGRLSAEISAQEFVSDLDDRLSDIEEFPIDLLNEAERKNFLNLIVEILSIENSLGITSKAVSVMSEHENIFCRCRILTDVRPIFGDELDEPKAAVIVHTLRLAYHNDDEHKEIYIALDDNDVSELIGALNRAERKRECLAAFLEKTTLPLLKV